MSRDVSQRKVRSEDKWVADLVLMFLYESSTLVCGSTVDFSGGGLFLSTAQASSYTSSMSFESTGMLTSLRVPDQRW